MATIWIVLITVVGVLLAEILVYKIFFSRRVISKDEFMSELFGELAERLDLMDRIGCDGIENEYMDLDMCKEVIDNTPNELLGRELEMCVADEQYELAEYIIKTAKKRGFSLKNKK